MSTIQDDELKFYNKRIKEFDKLLAQAKSQTLINLINKAKAETNNSVNKLIEIQRAIVIYLTAYDIKNKEWLEKFQDQIDNCNIEVKKLKESSIPDELRQSLNNFYKDLFKELDSKISQREEVRKLTNQVFTLCANEFKRTLLEMILKPNTGQFHYETIIDILNYIATKFIPGLEEMKTISNFPVSFRRKQFTKSGDKVLIYLEQYIDVLEKWTSLGDRCIKIAED